MILTESPVFTTGYFTRPEEDVHFPAGDCGRVEIREACATGRSLAARFAGLSPPALAAILRVRLEVSCWGAGMPALVCFAESDIRDRTVSVNQAALSRASRSLRDVPGLGSWAEEHTIGQVVLAHELYHVATGRAGGRKVEVEAHAFARELAAIPFSPLLFEWAACRWTASVPLVGSRSDGSISEGLNHVRAPLLPGG